MRICVLILVFFSFRSFLLVEGLVYKTQLLFIMNKFHLKLKKFLIQHIMIDVMLMIVFSNIMSITNKNLSCVLIAGS